MDGGVKAKENGQTPASDHSQFPFTDINIYKQQKLPIGPAKVGAAGSRMMFLINFVVAQSFSDTFFMHVSDVEPRTSSFATPPPPLKRVLV